MTLLDHIALLDDHTVLHGVSWDDYERVLEEIGDGSTRVTYCDGSMEIMSPLPEHDRAALAIGRLICELTFETGLPIASFGSTTYRRKDLLRGLEPDQCFYIDNEVKVRGMKRFNPKMHPAPDLAIEVDITSRSIPREPIYAKLGVPEIWRYKNPRIAIRRLSNGKYADAATSLYFPSLPMPKFEKFVQRMLVEEQNSVVRDFRAWVKTLPR
ncbi:MAG TPA: Uma2 family endonuclease [Tepidisphaeraceae bacterium]|jgi:Uma2 family endonuclease|nr:Uma2 family endonuclease [Tepidisphaeraceae bacterium]